MKNIKYIGHIKKGNRYIITVEKSEWFGWIKTRSQYIDSSSFYTHNKNKTAFFMFPEMVVISNGEEILEFLNGCLRKIIFDETGVVDSLGKNRGNS